VECSEPIEETPRQLQFHDLRDKLARTNFQRVPRRSPCRTARSAHGKFYRRSESVFPSSSIKLIGKRDYSLASSSPGTKGQEGGRRGRVGGRRRRRRRRGELFLTGRVARSTNELSISRSSDARPDVNPCSQNAETPAETMKGRRKDETTRMIAHDDNREISNGPACQRKNEGSGRNRRKHPARRYRNDFASRVGLRAMANSRFASKSEESEIGRGNGREDGKDGMRRREREREREGGGRAN